MKTKVMVEKRDKYTFFYVNFNGVKIGIKPYKSGYQLLEMYANNMELLELKYELGKVYLKKENTNIRIFGEDWTAKRVIEYMGGIE